MNLPDTLLRDMLTINAFRGIGAYGPLYTDGGASTRAYCEPSARLVRNADGETVVSDCFAILPADTAIAPRDRVSWNGQTYQVITVQPLRPGGVMHHQEVTLQSVTV